MVHKKMFQYLDFKNTTEFQLLTLRTERHHTTFILQKKYYKVAKNTFEIRNDFIRTDYVKR